VLRLVWSRSVKAQHFYDTVVLVISHEIDLPESKARTFCEVLEDEGSGDLSGWLARAARNAEKDRAAAARRRNVGSCIDIGLLPPGESQPVHFCPSNWPGGQHLDHQDVGSASAKPGVNLDLDLDCAA
jgi:hypothetical protein